MIPSDAHRELFADLPDRPNRIDVAFYVRATGTRYQYGVDWRYGQRERALQELHREVEEKLSQLQSDVDWVLLPLNYPHYPGHRF